MHPRDGVVVVVNVGNGYIKKWPVNWWPMLVPVVSPKTLGHFQTGFYLSLPEA
jgi:hypothetical protein